MVKICCVAKCKKTSRSDNDVSFFSWPLRNKDLLKKWLEIIPTNNRISAYTQICSMHFEESQYKCLSGRRYLKKDAIPCIFSFDNKINKEDETLTCEQSMPTVDKAIQSTPQTQNAAVQVSPKQLIPSESEKNLRQQIKILQKKLRYRESKISNVCEFLKQLRKEGKCSGQIEKLLLKRLAGLLNSKLQNKTENNIISNPKQHYSDIKADLQ